MSALALTSLAAAVSLAGVPLAPQMELDGRAVVLSSCGIRDTLWIEHYVAALYVPPGASAQAVSDPAQPKAVRIHILERRWLPREVPRKWLSALQLALADDPLRRVRGAYSTLADGDEILIAYVPQHGTDMRVNGSIVTHAVGHGVIDSLLRTWAGREPVAGKLDRLASTHPC
ncbi:MAG TPA: chalcone isomerase family protein [Burkholderiales bacterium]|nr:chalcone isomerase family protein [Burkholderiales bacterium]